jgi:hypothetical protein
MLEVGDHREMATWTGELFIPKETFGGNATLGFPLIGRVHLVGSATGTEDFPDVKLRMTIGGFGPAFANPTEDYPLQEIEADWLRACQPGSECTVPIEISLLWPAGPDGDGDVSVGRVRFDFELNVTLEYLDRSAVPSGARLVLEGE